MNKVFKRQRDHSKAMDLVPAPICFRSASEKRLAEEILAREGKWDETQQCFLTKEKQLQELSRKFAALQSLLRHAPSQAYQHQGDDLNAVYPKCPRLLLKIHNVNNSQLSLEDPTKQNIEYRRQLAEKNTLLREREAESTRGGVVFDTKERNEWIQRIESEFLHISKGSAKNVAKLNGNMSVVQNASATKKEGNVGEGSSSLNMPRINDGKNHSSLLMQLKRTKSAVSRFQDENSTVKSILTMKTSASLKNAITRMFADPKSAAAISQDEYDRREREYMEERSRMQAYQNDLLRDERETMERELAHFK